MSKITVDQKTIRELLTDKKSVFLIPDYQRPYAWEEEQCQTLWDDVFSFAIPDDDRDKFNSDDEYFLGSIVTFKNDHGQLEVIDGQQRLTTFLLILRAFYDKFSLMQDQTSVDMYKLIAQCIWSTDEFGRPDMERLKIDSEVATDNDKDEFLEILRTGEVPSSYRSKYANNFRYFQNKIQELSDKYMDYPLYFLTRILNNCVILPIEAESQDTALRIFSTLNDRGLPLSDADIFKAQFYKYYGAKGEKDEFIANWKRLEDITEQIFNPPTGTPMDELFTRYMYYLRSLQGNKSTTVESLRKFFERGKYELLRTDDAIEDLLDLAVFWQDVANQDKQRFNPSVLRKLFVLNYAPNGVWQYITSVYFMKNKIDKGDNKDILDNDKFGTFLDKIIAFIYAYAIYNPGVNQLRTPVFAEMIKIINGQEVDFVRDDGRKWMELPRLSELLNSYGFTNGRPITRSLLTWYAFHDENQNLLEIDQKFEIEHIFAKKRQEIERTLQDPASIESLGNKILLEKGINIRAADYRFADKKRYYLGYEDDKGRVHDASAINEYQKLVKAEDFTENSIQQRRNDIFSQFKDMLVAEQVV
jgi:uncharacterized protein with ParB-like and HNH nuclease domain